MCSDFTFTIASLSIGVTPETTNGMELSRLVDIFIELSIKSSFACLRGFLYAGAGHTHGLVIDHFCRVFEAVQPSIQNLIIDHLEDRAEFYEAEEELYLGENDGYWNSEEDIQDLDEDIFAFH